METITLPHGYVLLPCEICRRLGLEAGMRLEVDFDAKTGCIRLYPLKFRSGNVLRGGMGKKNDRPRRSANQRKDR